MPNSEIRIPIKMSKEFEELLSVTVEMIQLMEKAVTLLEKIKADSMAINDKN